VQSCRRRYPERNLEAEGARRSGGNRKRVGALRAEQLREPADGIPRIETSDEREALLVL
jgi:hypothetical protein